MYCNNLDTSEARINQNGPHLKQQIYLEDIITLNNAWKDNNSLPFDTPLNEKLFFSIASMSYIFLFDHTNTNKGIV